MCDDTDWLLGPVVADVMRSTALQATEMQGDTITSFADVVMESIS